MRITLQTKALPGPRVCDPQQLATTGPLQHSAVTPVVPRPSLRQRACLAFTMVEIAICLAIIGFALVAIIGILPIGMSVQKDNREETIINFDAKYLMDAIRSGALGQDELTNYIVSITNYWMQFDPSRFPAVPGKNGVDWYNTFTNGSNPDYYSINNVGVKTQFLTNGLNIVGLLSTPKFNAVKGGLYRSNYVTVDIRAITGSPMDQGASTSSRDFAFTYRVFPEIIPFGVSDSSLTNWNTNTISAADKNSRFIYATYATNLQANLNEVRLRFRWPVLPNSQTGPGNQIYRSVVGGALRQTNFVTTLYYFRPQTYTNGLQVYAGGAAFFP